MLPFIYFRFEIYKEFLVYLIARLNLAINEQSDNLGMGLMTKQYGGVWERIEGEWGYREFG